jgi:imidazolonepropionase-like amidohydrolase
MLLLIPGIQSDHPVTDSRFLLFEAQQAHYYGLQWNTALLAVTGTPAQILGQDHRIGFLKKGKWLPLSPYSNID